MPYDPEYRLGRKLQDLFALLLQSEDRTLTFSVYNILTRKTRKVNVTPNKNWGNNDSLLGAVLRYENYSTALERVYRIAQVYPNSPASEAGLIPEYDYLLGSPQNYYLDLQEFSAFLNLIVDTEANKVDMWVYNSKSNSVRKTTIIPRKKWGGKGLLGCEFGLGMLNELPVLPENDLQLQQLESLENCGLQKVAGTGISMEEFQQEISQPTTTDVANEINQSGPQANAQQATDGRLEEYDKHSEVSKGENPFKTWNGPEDDDSANNQSIQTCHTSDEQASPQQQSKILQSPEPKIEQKYQKEGMTMKTSQDYTFFSRKLNGDYIIRSDNLFQIEQILNA